MSTEDDMKFHIYIDSYEPDLHREGWC